MNENQIASRDFLTTKIWDIRAIREQNNEPVIAIYTNNYCEKNLSTMYENENIFDKFFLEYNPKLDTFVTGGYNN